MADFIRTGRDGDLTDKSVGGLGRNCFDTGTGFGPISPRDTERIATSSRTDFKDMIA
jgi:hypothetical protein